jgi:hypothetical protein
MVIINQGRSLVEGSVDELLNSEETVVRIEVDRSESAVQFLQAKFNPQEISAISPTELEVFISKKLVPDLTKELVLAGFAVHSIEPKRKLEDYFIKTIQS